MKLRARELEELAADERRYRRIVENVPTRSRSSISRCSSSTSTRSSSRRSAALRDAILGRPCQPFTHPEDHERELPMLEAVLRGESDGYTIEKRYERADGSFVWANLALASIRDDDGAPTQLLAVIEDISSGTASPASSRRARRVTAWSSRRP